MQDIINKLTESDLNELLDILDNELNEDADNVSHRVPKLKSLKKSRIAKKRYADNKEVYDKAFGKFRNSAKGKLFYKKLGRLKSRRAMVSSIDNMIDRVLEGKDVNTVIHKYKSDQDHQWDYKPTPDEQKVLDEMLKAFIKSRTSDRTKTFTLGSLMNYLEDHFEDDAWQMDNKQALEWFITKLEKEGFKLNTFIDKNRRSR